MAIGIRIALTFLVTGTSLAAPPVQDAELTEDMRALARMYAALDARDQKAYCGSMHATAYADYVDRACQFAIKVKLKQPEDCSQERIAQEVKQDAAECLAMPADEFEKKAFNGREVRAALVKQMQEHGVDGEKLLQEERAKIDCGRETCRSIK